MSVQDHLNDLLSGIRELKSLIPTVPDGTPARAKIVELCSLNAHSLMETFLEDLFYASMLGEHPDSGVAPVLSVASKRDVDLVIYSHGSRREKYLSWLPLERVEARSGELLEHGAPFSWLQKRHAEREILKELAIVRNAVAHPDAYAFRRLQDLADQKRYPISRPADYLLSLRSGNPEIEHILAMLPNIASALSCDSEKKADGILQPETPYPASKAVAPSGVYECSVCGNQIALLAPARLDHCATCNTSVPCSACGRSQKATTMWNRIVQ